jgi:serine/threonine-protein kinase RsbW
MTDPALTPPTAANRGARIPELADLVNSGCRGCLCPSPATAAASASHRSARAWLASLRWRRVFPGEARELAAVRRWLGVLLPGCPARDDVMCVATELGFNALRHTASGRGGQFAVEVGRDASVVRVAVSDGGALSGPRVVDDPLRENGRGLLLVRGLSLRYGVCGGQRGRLVWADIPCGDPGAPASGSPAEVIDDRRKILGEWPGVVPAWFGRPVLPQDLAGRAGTVTAASAAARVTGPGPHGLVRPGHDCEEKDRMTQRRPGCPAKGPCGSCGRSARRPPPGAVLSPGEGCDA